MVSRCSSKPCCNSQPSSLASELAVAAMVKCIHEFTVDVDLQLFGGGIADANRLGALVATEPRHFPFWKTVLADEPIHDLHPGRIARHRPQQPLPPRPGIFVVAGIHQSEQRKGGVAQPTKSIIPITLAAEPLRQRRRGRSDDAAGCPVGQRLQRQQRAGHGAGILSRRPRAAGPAAPVSLGVRQALAPGRSDPAARDARRHRSKRMGWFGRPPR